ncbi:MAG: biotin--[acetyl-CoA-carboxylase] ligase [Candidatus Margulisiibacteriota bacterium]
MIIGKKLITYDQLSSTNQTAMELGKEGAEEGMVIYAKNQTAGRGKPGANWFAKSPGSLTFSLILRPRKNADEISAITQVGARALQKSLKDKFNLDATIKLPNDVLINGKKVCGILTERAQDKNGAAFVVMGVGVNVNLAPEDFPADLALSATSLQIELGKGVGLDLFFNALLAETDKCYGAFLRRS